jgi:hypothetical protein
MQLACPRKFIYSAGNSYFLVRLPKLVQSTVLNREVHAIVQISRQLPHKAAPSHCTGHASCSRPAERVEDNIARASQLQDQPNHFLNTLLVTAHYVAVRILRVTHSAFVDKVVRGPRILLQGQMSWEIPSSAKHRSLQNRHNHQKLRIT